MSKARVITSSVIGVLGALAIGVFAYVLSPAPTVLGGDSYNNVKHIGANAPMQITFSTWMDQDATKDAFSLEPSTEGTLTWKGNTLVFTPKERFEEGSSYTATIQASAKSALGKKIEKPYQVGFLITAPPEVVFASPKDITVERTQPLTIMFSNPMVALSALGDEEKNAISLDITPETKGHIDWIDSQTMQFIPDTELVASANYVVTVKAGSTSVNGGFTEQDYQFTFETAEPQVMSVSPENDYTLAGPPTPVVLTFNQPMELADVKEYLSFEPAEEVEVSYPESDHAIVAVKAKDGWNFDTSYTGTLRKDVPGAQGEKTMINDFNWRFSTVGQPSLIESDPSTEEKDSSTYGLSLSFNTTFPEDALKDKVRIEPAIEEFVSEHNEGNYLYFDTSFDYSTTYTVTIPKGIKDIYDQEIAEDIVITFTTRDRPQSIGITKTDYFNLFSAKEKAVYPINTINISSFDATLCAVSVDTFMTTNVYSDQVPNCDATSTWKEFVSGEKNKTATTYLDLQAHMGTMAPGIYFLKVHAPEIEEDSWRREDRVYFFLTNTALSLKKDKEQLLVWATDITTGEPVQDMSMTVYNEEGGVLTTGTTNDKGLFVTPIDTEGNAYVLGEKGTDMSLISGYWTSGIASWDFDLNQEYYDSPYIGYLYTERPIYRPGQTVSFKGMVRFDNDAFYSLPESGKTVTLTVSDAQYNTVDTQTLTLSDNGTFNGELTLSSEASLGQYRIEWQLGEEYLRRGGYRSFYVEEYKAPEFKLDITPKKDALINGDDLSATIEGSYFFGGPLANSPVTWTLKKSNYFFNEYDKGWYNFSADESYEFCYWGGCDYEEEVITSGETTLDSAGKASVNIPLQTKDDIQSKLYTLEVTASDSSNQTVSGRVSIPWHMGEYYIGMRNQSYVVQANDQASFDIITVTPQGNPLANKSVTVEFYKRDWKSVKKKNVDGNYYWTSETEDTLVGTKETTTDSEGKGSISFIPTEGGYYVAKGSSKDNRGNTVRSLAGVYVSSDDFVSWGQTNNNRIDLITDKTEYKLGDTAKVLIASPFEKAKALITYERENVFHYEVIDIPTSSHTLEIPITDQFLPNTFVSVLLVKGASVEEGEKMKQIIPEFRVGYKNILVDTESKHLNIEISTNKERYLPGEEVTMTINTRDFSGNPTDAEVAIGVVDASVLALKGNPKENLLEEFYFERGLGVQTAANLTIFTETIDVAQAAAKGGGGGDEGLENKKRGDFKDTAYWNPTVETVNGTATINFTLPDNLTTWHVVGLGITDNTLVGNSEHDILATKELLARPVLPRFVRFEDRVEVGTIVHNFTDKDQILTVSMDATNVTFKDGKEKNSVRIPAGSEQKLTWNVQVNGDSSKLIDFSTFTIAATNNEVTDNVEVTIPILQYATPETVSLFGSTNDTKSEFVALPDTIHENLGGLLLTVRNALVSKLGDGLTYLVQYPYGCSEQITSRLLALATYTMAGETSQKYLGTDADPALLSEVKSYVEEGLPRIYETQRSDGGFGYWTGSNRSYPYLTTYVTYGLYTLQQAGFTVDQDVMQRSIGFIKTYLGTGEADARTQFENSQKAFMLYLLAELGQGDIGLTNNLYPKRSELTVEAQAYLALTLNKLGDSKANTVLEELVANALQDAQGRYTHFGNGEVDKVSMSSDIRTTAVALRAMLAISSDHVLIPKTVRWLQDKKEQGYWNSTQDTIHTLIALKEYVEKIQQSPVDTTTTVAINNQDQEAIRLTSDETSKEIFIAIEDFAKGVSTQNEVTFNTDNTVFYDMELTYFRPVQEIESLNRGFSIRRQYFALDDDKEEKPLNFANTGDTLKGKLTIVVPADRYAVAVEANLPAGFEGVNFNLETTQQSLQDELNTDEKQPWWYTSAFNHEEIRDDRVVLFADHLPAGVYEYEYLVNVTTPGIFNHPPARIYEMYYPEVFGRSSGSLINIK